MQFVNNYKINCGQVSVRSGTGYIYSLYDVGDIQELDQLREAGFHHF
jgi:hypothetical protein